MGEELVLLNFWVSVFGARVRIALEEKGLSYEEGEEDLENKSPILMEMNPVHKKIPVLIHNGKPVCESMIIVEYIDEVWNHKAHLLPSDPYPKSQARLWADFIDKKIYGAGSKLRSGEQNNVEESKEEAEEGKKELIEILKLLERVLGDGPYFGGESFGYVDIALVGFYMYFHSYEMFGDFSIAFECPKLIAWANMSLKRESVSKSLSDPNKVFDLVITYRNKFGLDK